MGKIDLASNEAALAEANLLVFQGESRRQISRKLCKRYGWIDARGRLQDMSCRVALLRLARQGKLKLPESRWADRRIARPEVPRKSVLGPPLSKPLDMLQPLRIALVSASDRDLHQSWNEAMGHHPLGPGPLCGAQLRYLISSRDGEVVSALAFSAAARRLEVRDRWLGWSECARAEHLQLVVNNSRFLVLPNVEVPNLASHVLAGCAKRLRTDWQAQYGYAPVLLETFVERDRHRGSCYRAAGWQAVGQTKGRGRQDRRHRCGSPVRDVFLLPMLDDFRKHLKAAPSAPTEQPADWAEREFGRASLPDGRLRPRLLTLARDFYTHPESSIPEACESMKKTKAAYRFLDHPEITMEGLLQPHIEATLGRLQGRRTVLALQDTTELDYSTHHATAGLGPMGTDRQADLRGLLLHSVFAVGTDGVPLGFLDAQLWSRPEREEGAPKKREHRHELPIDQKESWKWIRAFRASAPDGQISPTTQVVSVGDREADIHELFLEAQKQENRPALLVRAWVKRRTMDNADLWKSVESLPIAGQMDIAQPKKRGLPPGRNATLALRFGRFTLKPPKRRPDLPPVSLQAIMVSEVGCTVGTPIEWFLLTTLPVESVEQAEEKVRWYALRWQIEVLHRTLKTGRRVEDRQLEDADNLGRCLALDLVVSWRILHITKLARETPDVPCTVAFDDNEWQVLGYFRSNKKAVPVQPPSLREMVRWVAERAGFLGRKGDGEPGPEKIWIGLSRLEYLALGWGAAKAAQDRPIVSGGTYG